MNYRFGRLLHKSQNRWEADIFLACLLKTNKLHSLIFRFSNYMISPTADWCLACMPTSVAALNFKIITLKSLLAILYKIKVTNAFLASWTRKVILACFQTKTDPSWSRTCSRFVCLKTNEVFYL